MIARILYAAIALVILGTVPRDAFRTAAGVAPHAGAQVASTVTPNCRP